MPKVTPKGQLKLWKNKGFQKGRCLNLVADVLQELRRLEEADEWGMCVCVTCGKRSKCVGGEMHGGHYISRGCSATKLEETNIHCQCQSCNIAQFSHKDRVARAYTEYMEANHPDEKQRLDSIFDQYGMSQAFEYEMEWLADKICEFRERIQVEKARLGI